MLKAVASKKEIVYGGGVARVSFGGSAPKDLPASYHTASCRALTIPCSSSKTKGPVRRSLMTMICPPGEACVECAQSPCVPVKPSAAGHLALSHDAPGDSVLYMPAKKHVPAEHIVERVNKWVGNRKNLFVHVYRVKNGNGLLQGGGYLAIAVDEESQESLEEFLKEFAPAPRERRGARNAGQSRRALTPNPPSRPIAIARRA